MGAVKAAIADFVLTMMWVFCSATLGVFTYLIASAFGIVQPMASLFITTFLLFVLFFVFGIVGDALGGAAFNPAGTAAFYAAGVGKDSLFTVATRFPAQFLEFGETWSLTTLGIFVYLIASAFGTVQQWLLCLLLLCFSVLFFVFGITGDALGGATFNPAGTAAFCAAGLAKIRFVLLPLDFLLRSYGRGKAAYTLPDPYPTCGITLSFKPTMLKLTLSIQSKIDHLKFNFHGNFYTAAGAVAGALAILEVVPTQFKHMLGGPSLKVDLHNGAIAEGILTFVMTFLVFMIVLKGPKNAVLKNWLLAMSTVTMVVAGSKYTGPSMNPANAFGWAYINNMHNTWEQLYVYWICPFIGAIMAAWTFRAVFPAPVKPKPKQKKKRN
ncbi:Aquaporin SIP1-1 [Capsicum chinense]|nr:Aquaporin SIP1-1 [Capsicum chinense]